jgi:hypothetical protein
MSVLGEWLRLSFASKTLTFKPFCARREAVKSPADDAPTIATSLLIDQSPLKELKQFK